MIYKYAEKPSYSYNKLVETTSSDLSICRGTFS